MRIMAQPPFPHHNVESRTQMSECKMLQNKRGFVASLSVDIFGSTLWWGKGGPRTWNYVFCKSTFILQTPDSEEISNDFSRLVWSPPFYAKSRPSHIFIVSHGSHVSRICRSKMGSLRCNWYRESRILGICGSGYLEIWNSWHLDTVQNGAIFVLFDFRFA